MKDPTILYTFIALMVFAVAYCIGEYFRSSHRRFRAKKKIACFFGRHEPGTPEDRVGGRRVQSCDWCGKDIREYQVTVDQARGETIRRIQ